MGSIGIVGAGTMGAGIAQVAARSGFDVFINDISPDAIDHAIRRITNDLGKGVERGKLTSEEASIATSRINSAPQIEALSGCEFIVEAAIEDLDLKKELFQRLEAVCQPSTILTSNTSSLAITAIAAGTQRPELVGGMHFFNPAHIMKLVEVVRGHRTSDETVEAIVDVAERLGKTPVIVRDTPGFIVNRIARPFYGEALRILGEGIATVSEIDRIVKLSGGFKMGPFELMDLIGIDVNFAVTKSMYEQTFGEPRYRPHPIQQRMLDAGLLGRKTGRGFYEYGS